MNEFEQCIDEWATRCREKDAQITSLQAALDAEREKVKGLEAQNTEWERKCRDLCLAHGPLLIEHHDVKRELTQLQALVRALPVVSEVTSDTVVNLVQQYSFHAWMLRALQLRATLDATTPAPNTSIIGKCEPPSQWNQNAQVRGDIS